MHSTRSLFGGKGEASRRRFSWMFDRGGPLLIFSAVAVVLCCAALLTASSTPTALLENDSFLPSDYNTALRRRAAAYWSQIGSVHDRLKRIREAHARQHVVSHDHDDDHQGHSNDWYLIHHMRVAHAHARDLMRKQSYAEAIRKMHDTHARIRSYLDKFNGEVDNNNIDYNDWLHEAIRLQAAQRAWSLHKYDVAELNEKISKEQAKLDRMNDQESELASRHSSLASELEALTQEADNINADVEQLKGKYSNRIDLMRTEYKKTAKSIAAQREAADAEMEANEADLEDLRGKVSRAMYKASNLKEQAAHAMDDVEERRKRTQKSREEIDESKAEAKKSWNKEVLQQQNEAHSLAGERANALEARATRDMARMDAASQKYVDKKKKQTIKMEAGVVVQDELAQAAQKAAKAAQEEEDEAREETDKLAKEIEEMQKQIEAAKQEASDEKVKGTEFEDKVRIAKNEYQDIVARRKRAKSDIESSEKLIESATAKQMQAETESKMAEMMAAGDAAVAKVKIEQAEDEIKDGEKGLEDNEGTVKENEGKREDLLKEELAALEAKLDAQSTAKLSYGKAELQKELARTELSSAQDRRDRADKLLKSVDALATLGKEAAEMARADQIKAEATAVAAGYDSPINVNILAHPEEKQEKPAEEPAEETPAEEAEEEEEEEAAKPEPKDDGPVKVTKTVPVDKVPAFFLPGIAAVAPDDENTKKLTKMGINV